MVPKEKSVGDVPFWQIGIHFQRATAVKLRLFEPDARWVDFKMSRCTDE